MQGLGCIVYGFAFIWFAHGLQYFESLRIRVKDQVPLPVLVRYSVLPIRSYM